MWADEQPEPFNGGLSSGKADGFAQPVLWKSCRNILFMALALSANAVNSLTLLFLKAEREKKKWDVLQNKYISTNYR